MSVPPPDARHAAEVLAAIVEARERVRHFRVSRESFLASEDVETRAVSDALLMCVLRATEEAGKLSDDVQRRYPEVSWRGIRGMRNILAHDYGHVDREIVWAALEKDFLVLEHVCREVLEDEGF